MVEVYRSSTWQQGYTRTRGVQRYRRSTVLQWVQEEYSGTGVLQMSSSSTGIQACSCRTGIQESRSGTGIKGYRSGTVVQEEFWATGLQ